MMARAGLVLLAWLGFSFAAWAETVEVAPGVAVTRKTYPVPANEAPFYNFIDKTPQLTELDATFVADTLKLVPDRTRAAEITIGSGWQALLAKGDDATAAKRFNQALLLDPRASGLYHGFAVVVIRRFRDLPFADELFVLAARMNAPAATLSADHGRMLLMAGQPARAKPLLERAVGEDPGWAVPKSNLAIAALQLGDRAEACRLSAEVAGRDLASVQADVAYVRREAGCL